MINTKYFNISKNLKETLLKISTVSGDKGVKVCLDSTVEILARGLKESGNYSDENLGKLLDLAYENQYQNDSKIIYN